MQKTLQGTIEETRIASVIETASDAVLRGPSRVNRPSIKRFLVRGPKHAFRVCLLVRG